MRHAIREAIEKMRPAAIKNGCDCVRLKYAEKAAKATVNRKAARAERTVLKWRNLIAVFFVKQSEGFSGDFLSFSCFSFKVRHYVSLSGVTDD